MARGQQKIQSQQKNAAKKLAQAKQKDGLNQKDYAKKALTHKCSVCMAMMPDSKTYKQHFENKHPKVDLPADLKDVPSI